MAQATAIPAVAPGPRPEDDWEELPAVVIAVVAVVPEVNVRDVLVEEELVVVDDIANGNC